MEKPTDSEKEEKGKHEGESVENASWVQIKYSFEDMEIMEQRLSLRSEGECPWRSAEGECFPAPEDSEVVLFASFLEYGLSMLVSNFMEGFFITIRSNSIILLLIQCYTSLCLCISASFFLVLSLISSSFAPCTNS